MNHKPPIALPTLTNIKRRAIASTAAAIGVTTLTGCGILGGGAQSRNKLQEPAATISSESANSKIKAFTQDLDEAIARLDKNKLKTVAEASAQEAVTPAAAAPSARRAKATAVTPPTDAAEEDPIPTALILERLELPLPGMIAIPSPTAFLATPNQHLPIFETAGVGDETPPLTFDDLTAPTEVDLPPVELAIESLRAHVASNPNLAGALALNLLGGKSGDPAIVAELSPNDQKILQDLTAVLQSMSGPANPAIPLAERAAPLIQTAKRWSPAAAEKDLTLPTLALASRVDSFGVYHKLDPKFAAGKKHTVIIYCEVANFEPRKSPDGWYETRLSQQETLATDDGLLLWRPNAEDVEDRSKNHRKDFYLVKKLTIPDNLAVGKYALRMSVTDRNTNKIAVVTLPIEIVK
jgi:hypothetical protein